MLIPGDVSIWQTLAPFAVGIAPWIIPAIISASSAFFGSRGKKKGGFSVPPGSPLFDYLTTGMIPGGGGGGGSSTTTRDETQTFDKSIFPFITDEYQPLNKLMRGLVEQRLRFPSGLPPGYETSGLMGINDTFGVIGKALETKLSELGQLGAPAQGVPLATLAGQRGRAISEFRSGLPQLERQFRNEDLQLASAILAQFGKGQREKGTVRTRGTSTTTGGGGGGGSRFDPSGPLQYLQMLQAGQKPGFFEQFLPLLGYLMGSGMFGGGGGAGAGGSGGGGTGGSGFGGIGF